MRIQFFFVLLSSMCSTFLSAQSSLLKTSNTIAIGASDSKDEIIRKAAHVIPTPAQLAALRNEFIAFIHFGPNTFTRLEWGTGKEDPAIFDLKNLDTDQWCAAMKAAGMKMVIITAKHHDGFVLWQSRYTKHGIMSTGYKNGKGDIVKELSASCKKFGLKLGIYLSPADLFQIESPSGLYGNLSTYTTRTIPRQVEGRPFANKTSFRFEADDYNEYFLNQLFELLTEYGPISEVWFDGAHPKRKGNQQYNYLAWRKLIRKLAPTAVVFGKEDIRWCGNENGATRPTEWNIIPYEKDPSTMNNFEDLTAATLGEREDLYKGKFLHYQQAETNTSIREGWFYRDDTRQKVRSVDDVFDIYERSVGGNSTFLLNIPPNREGRFSAADSAALYQVGERISNTYGKNLFQGAAGPSQVLDKNISTFLLMTNNRREIIISTPKPVTINRLVLQEAVATHSERVEQHWLDAWIDNGWKEIARSSNIGYKRILRFPETTSGKFRLRIGQTRLDPAIATISAHYYATRPPQLGFTMDKEGLITIAPLLHDFGWNPHGQNAAANLNTGYEIYYTQDGSEPGKQSTKYESPFVIRGKEVKAVAIDKKSTGAVSSKTFGIIKRDWKLSGVSSERDKHSGSDAFDANPSSYWQTKDGEGPHFISIDLGTTYQLKGFAYTPQTRNGDGMMERGIVQVSSDGESWTKVGDFYFGNLIKDPTTRTQYFPGVSEARYIRIEATAIAGNGKSLAIAELDFFEN